ncbi:DUF2164 family protein [Thermodesulfobacteriota bacterium]
MTKTKRSWDLISQEKRRDSIKDIIDFFMTERDEEIGVIAAENILDHFLQGIGLDLYNKGIEDSKNFLVSRFEDIELDMEALLKK